MVLTLPIHVHSILFSVSYLREGYTSFSVAHARDVSSSHFHLPSPHFHSPYFQSITISYLFYYLNICSLHLYSHYSKLLFPDSLSCLGYYSGSKVVFLLSQYSCLSSLFIEQPRDLYVKCKSDHLNLPLKAFQRLPITR